MHCYFSCVVNCVVPLTYAQQAAKICSRYLGSQLTCLVISLLRFPFWSSVRSFFLVFLSMDRPFQDQQSNFFSPPPRPFHGNTLIRILHRRKCKIYRIFRLWNCVPRYSWWKPGFDPPQSDALIRFLSHPTLRCSFWKNGLTLWPSLPFNKQRITGFCQARTCTYWLRKQVAH